MMASLSCRLKDRRCTGCRCRFHPALHDSCTCADLVGVGGHRVRAALIAGALAIAGVVARDVAAVCPPKVRVLQLRLPVPVGQSIAQDSDLQYVRMGQDLARSALVNALL